VHSGTQIVCLHEGVASNTDAVFIYALIKALNPSWLRPWTGSNVVRTRPCGGRASLMQRIPDEIAACRSMGGSTVLMVWADVDDDMADGDALKRKFWQHCKAAGVQESDFDDVVFVFAKDRLENWIEFLETGRTDEAVEGPRAKSLRSVRDAARRLAMLCATQADTKLPPSLGWSCANWRQLVARMS